MAKIYAVVDTNKLLHFRSFRDVDWRGILGADEVVLVFAKVVLQELDRKKNETARTKKRATRVLKDINELIDVPKEIRAKVTAQFAASEPTAGTLTTNALEAAWNDDRIIGYAIELREKCSDDESVVIVTADTGLKVQAKSRGFSVVSLPDDHKLPEEPDPVEKELADAKRQLAEIADRAPVINVELMKPRRWRPYSDTAALPDGYVGRLQDAQRQVAIAEKRLRDGKKAMFAAMTSSVDQVALDLRKQYFDAMDAFGKAAAKRSDLVKRLVLIQPRLVNTGSGDASDVHLFLIFPDGTKLYEKADIPSERREPQPPPEFRSFDLGDAIDVAGLTSRHSKTPRIDGVKFTTHLDGIKHGMDAKAETPFYASVPIGQTIEVEYRVVVAGGFGDAAGTFTVPGDGE